MSTAAARPTAPGVLCREYSTIPECSGKLVSCNFCHDNIAPATWNAFGSALKDALEPGVAFEQALASALQDTEEDDADGDGLSNLAELTAGTLPGDPRSVARPGGGPMDAGVAAAPGAPRDAGKVPITDQGDIDLPFAYRRVSTLYCGRSPSYEELTAFEQAATTEEAGREQLHALLASCLQSDYWLKNALPRLADKRIKPQGSIGPDTQIRLGPLRLVLGDYNYDYRLWRWVMSDDHDMRELLTADYHVVEGPDGTLRQTREVIRKTEPLALAGGQPLPPQYRAGMITTQWFLGLNTMFSALPRTTAAQAYRAYLGADISAGEGLIPVPGEPTDVDNKGVDAPACAGCHSTLDPLAYAFMRYEGISAGYTDESGRTAGIPSGAPSPGLSSFQRQGAAVGFDLGIGGYNAGRPKQRIRAWDDAIQKPVVLGKPVPDLLEWARVASESDQFKRNLAEMFFIHAFGQKPTGAQLTELNAVWRAMPEDGYSANRLIHRLIDTQSFGAP